MREYFTDRDLGKQFPAMLRDVGITVHAAHEHFAPATPDEEWISQMELIGKVSTRDLATNFINTHHRVERFLERHQPPLIAAVYRPIPKELTRHPNAPGRIELKKYCPRCRRHTAHRDAK